MSRKCIIPEAEKTCGCLKCIIRRRDEFAAFIEKKSKEVDKWSPEKRKYFGVDFIKKPDWGNDETSKNGS